MTMKNIFTISAAALLLAMGGCIENDIPYPHIGQRILAIGAVGESRPASIDSVNAEVTLYLDEDVDIEKVRFDNCRISEGAESTPNLLEGVYNLSDTLSVTLHRWYDYTWKVSAVQNIERYFQVEGQIGEAEINVSDHTVTVSVPEDADVSALKVVKVKLGPDSITSMSPALVAGAVVNLSEPMHVDVSCWGRTTQWTITAVVSKYVVKTTSVDPWSEVIWAYGNGPADVSNGFQYKEAGAEEWIDVPMSRVKQSDGVFSASIPHLKPLTGYVVRTVSGKNIGNEIAVTTQATADIPNGDFENWCKIGKIVYPFAEDGQRFWDTGNTGSATLGDNITVSSDITPTGSGLSAQCTTKFIGFFGIGKLAAGSIFTGSFKKVDGTNGILDFGQPWTLRPTKLKGYFMYKGKNIDYTTSEYSELKGQPDTCIVYVALTDWTAPYEIRTNPKNRQLFDKDAPYVIGYGEMQFSGTMEQFKDFVIDIKYRDTARVPSYLLITCSTSKYGDYFTGGNGSVLWVDQFSFGWDLDE